MTAMRQRATRIGAVAIAALVLLRASPSGQSANPTFAVLGVPEEIAPIERRLTDPETQRIGSTVVTTGSIDGRRIVVGRSGIGKVNAAAATTVLIDRFRPAALIFSGTAGALDPALGPGDVVIATKVAQHDIGRVTPDGFMRRPTRDSVTGEPNPLFLDAPPELLAAARAAVADVKLPPAPMATGTRQPRVHEGVIVTGDVFVADPIRKRELREFGGSAVEMEGAAIAQVCYEYGVPCAIVRTISDTADAHAPASFVTFLTELAGTYSSGILRRFLSARG